VVDRRSTSLTLLGRLHNLQDQEAWRRFVGFYGPMVYRLGRRRGLDPESADALVQAFCARAVELMPKFQYAPQRGRFRNWVLQVALNELREAKRREAARGRAHEAYTKRLPERAEPPVGELETWWKAEESKRLLQAALERLRQDVDEDKFAVFELTARRGMDPEKVASSYGLTKSQVAVIKHRMTSRLNEIIRQLRKQWHLG
jgi:RNA polymerase sigma-70 factor (ECF subfamily)